MKTFTDPRSIDEPSGPPDNFSLCQFTSLWPHPSHVNGNTATRGRVKILSRFGRHSKACRIRVSGFQGLALVDFTAGDAEITLALAGDDLQAVTSALMARLTPKEIVCIIEALGGAR